MAQAALVLLLALIYVLAPLQQVSIAPTHMRQDTGHAFSAQVGGLLLYRVSSDIETKGASPLIVFENGRPLGPAHASHADVRTHGRGAYSHWGGTLYFSTSDNTDPKTNGRTYAIAGQTTARPGVLALALIASLVLGWRALGDQSNRMAAFETLVRRGWIGCLAISGLYLAIVLPSLLAGDVFAAARPLRWIGAPTWLIALENALPRTIVLLAFLGSLSVWLSMAGLLDRHRLQALEHELLHGRLRFGSPVIAALLLASLGTAWLGIDNPSQYTYVSLFGQLPHSDGGNYAASSFGRIAGWDMTPWAARRPVAQSLRDLSVWLAGGSYTVTLMVQTVALALALAFAARRLMLWRGIWPGVALVGLVFLHSRFFITSTMTEPLGMTVALVTLGLLVDAVRFGSRQHALLALTWLSLALSIRMGAILVVPAVALWIVLALAPRGREQLKVAAWSGAIVIGVMALGWLLKTIYAAPGAQIGGNFAQTLCGLSVGGDWTACAHKLYGDEVRRTVVGHAQESQFYFAKAIENIRLNPSVFMRQLVNNVRTLFSGFLAFFTTGYYALPRLSSSVETAALVLAVPGLVWSAWRLASARELTLWASIGAGIVVSSAIIMADDGWRALHVSHAMVACFIAMACIGAAAPTPGEPVPIRGAVFATVTFVLMLAAGPYLLARLGPRDVDHVQGNATERIIFGGRQTLGLIVTSDAETRFTGPRVVRWSEFRKAYSRAYSTDADATATVALMEKRLPFGYVLVVQSDPRKLAGHFFVPPEVVSRADVPRWRINVDPSSAMTGDGIIVVNGISAEPLP